MSSIQRLAPAAPGPALAQGPEVNQMLMNSLRAMSASSADPGLAYQLQAQQAQAAQAQQYAALMAGMGLSFQPVKQERQKVKREVKQEAAAGAAVKQEQFPTIKAVKKEANTRSDVMTDADLAAFGMGDGVEITSLPRVHR